MVSEFDFHWVPYISGPFATTKIGLVNNDTLLVKSIIFHWNRHSASCSFN